MTDRLDLILLNAKAPVGHGASASLCGRWREAADVWLDCIGEPAFRDLSARCGLEASLRAGLYDLAQFFRLKIGPTLDDFADLRELWRESLPVRRARARYHRERLLAHSGAVAQASPQRLIELRMYPEAIGRVFQETRIRRSSGASSLLLARCHEALGEHEAVLSLRSTPAWGIGGSELRTIKQRAKARLSLWQRPDTDNVRLFATSHPAGSLLTPFLEAPRLAFDQDG